MSGGCASGGPASLPPAAGAGERPAPTDLMVWSLCRMTSWICRSTVTLVSSSSCFCVLASATHVRYVAMASSAWGGAQGAPGEASAWGSGPTQTPDRQDAHPGQGPEAGSRHRGPTGPRPHLVLGLLLQAPPLVQGLGGGAPGPRPSARLIFCSLGHQVAGLVVVLTALIITLLGLAEVGLCLLLRAREQGDQF